LLDPLRGGGAPAPPAATAPEWWDGKVPTLSVAPPKRRRYHADGVHYSMVATSELPNAELAARLLEIAETGDDGESKTGRRFFYLALSYGYINPDMGASDAAKQSREAAYKRIGDVLGKLRKSGRLSWQSVLDLTRELDEWLTFDSPRDARAVLRRQYDEDRWLGQPFYPFNVVEKDTMEPVCKPMAKDWQMPFASSRGYASLTLQHDVAERIVQRYAQTGQTAIIYFASDHDPSGLDLQLKWEEAMRAFNAPARIVRIALTIEQVRNSALDIERLGIGVKPTDSRAKNYIRQFGNRCWEADILPAAIIRQTLDREITRWLDRKLWDRRRREIEAARALL
jgi:hypothetical protein